MIRWSGRNQAHPSEERVGRITRKGRWDRRYKVRPDEPKVINPMRTIAEILVGFIVMLAIFVGVLGWIAIATVAR